MTYFLRITAAILIFTSFSVTTFSQTIQEFKFKKKAHFTRSSYHSSESSIFIYRRTTGKNTVLIKAGKRGGRIVEKELEVELPKGIKRYAQINSNYVKDQLFEMYWCHFEIGARQNEYAIFMVQRSPVNLEQIGDALELHTFSKRELEGDFKTRLNQSQDHNELRTYAFVQELNKGYFVTILEKENEEVVCINLNENFKEIYKFNYHLNSDGRYQTYSLDRTYEVPFAVSYADVVFKEDGKKKEGVNLVVNWLDIESEKFKETKLIVEKKYEVYNNFSSELNLDDNEITITQSFKNIDPGSEHYTGTGIIINVFDLTDGTVLNEREVYLKERDVVGPEYLDLLAKYKVNYFENNKKLFTHFRNGLNIYPRADSTFLVYSDHLLKGYQGNSKVQKTIYNSAFVAQYDADWNLIWSKFLPFDPSKSYINNNRFIFFKDCFVLLGFNHLESYADEGVKPKGKKLKAMEGILYIMDYETGSLIQKKRVWSPKDGDGSIDYYFTRRISDTELLIKVGEITKLIDFGTLTNN